MKKIAFVALKTALVAGCAGTQTGGELAPSTSLDSMARAESALAEAREKGAVWMIIDESTGKTAVPLPKILDAARKAEKSGDADEANRIAEKVATFADLGVKQIDAQPDPRPFYP